MPGAHRSHACAHPASLVCGMIEKAIVFECENEQLVGIVSDPGGHSQVGVVVTAGGPQYRAGSHRLFVLLARRLASAGIPVLRFDYRGMGDSSGTARSFEDVDEDIACALSAFRMACPAVDKIVLWGLCDAASANLLSWHARSDPRVAGMVLLNPWVMSEATHAVRKMKDYALHRLASWSSWKAFVRGGTDSEAARALSKIRDYYLRPVFSREFWASAKDGPLKPGPARTAADYRERMRLAMEDFPGPILLVLSGTADLVARAYRERMSEDPAWMQLLQRRNIEEYVLPDADHTFATDVWREDVEARTLGWIRRSFSPAHEVANRN